MCVFSLSKRCILFFNYVVSASSLLVLSTPSLLSSLSLTLSLSPSLCTNLHDRGWKLLLIYLLPLIWYHCDLFYNYTTVVYHLNFVTNYCKRTIQKAPKLRFLDSVWPNNQVMSALFGGRVFVHFLWKSIVDFDACRAWIILSVD